MLYLRFSMIVTGLLLLAPTALAQSSISVDWAMLADPAAQQFDDPYRDLTPSQFQSLMALAQLRIALEEESPEVKREEMVERASALTEDLRAQGLDPDWILAQREAVAARRQHAALATNDALEGQYVELTGYLLVATDVEDGAKVAFLLPDRGVCMHLPPPVPNRLIRLKIDELPEPLGPCISTALRGRLSADETRATVPVFDDTVSLWSRWKLEVSEAITSGALSGPVAHAQDWEPVTGKVALTELLSNTQLEGTLKDGVTGVARYNADGTAVLEAWGGSFERNWRIEDNDRICVVAGNESWCTKIEQDASNPDQYRATRLDTGEQVEFSLSGQSGSVASAAPADNKGGPAQPSAEELALKLSNPTAPVMTLGNNFDFVMFDGDLGGASDETSFRYTFQSVFPFKRDDGSSVFFRPAIPVFFSEPVPRSGGGFDSVGTELGDIGFDLSYGKTTSTGMILGAGVAGTLPTATDDRLGKDLWGLGPELLVGKIGNWGAVIGVLSHQWDLGGSGDGSINITSLNYVYAFQLGGGWQLASAPAITYNHDAEDGQEWTVPLGVGIARTTVIKGRPWKFQLQYWNYVERSDVFAPEHQFRISISPVVSAPWNE